MTTEEKAKAYDDALEKAKKYHEEYWQVDAKDITETLFPQLRESENERIRKALIDALKVSETIGELKFRLPYPTREECIAYLEKQKEQKPRKFKLGDKVHWHDDDVNIITITGFLDDAYLTDSAYGPILFSDEGNWEIIEKKPADDKAFEEWIDDWWKHNKVNNPDSYDKDDEVQFDEKGFKNFCRGIRNMYANQESAEWSEDDDAIVESILFWLKSVLNISCYPRYEHWLKSLPERFNLQPKQEWSEEDEKHINLILQILDRQQCWDGATGKKFNRYQDEIDWLKSLRPKPHWKPSEEQISSLKQARDYYMSGRIKYVGRHLSEIAEQLEKLM